MESSNQNRKPNQTIYESINNKNNKDSKKDNSIYIIKIKELKPDEYNTKKDKYNDARWLTGC